MNRKRSQSGNLHKLEVHECPLEVLSALAAAAGVGVTVENVVPLAAIDQWFESEQSIQPGGAAQRCLIRNARFDIALTNQDFLDLLPFWDARGVYAVFTERSPLSFQASRLQAPGRYRALENFGFVLEFALAGPASDDWSEIVSPRAGLIDLAEKILADI